MPSTVEDRKVQRNLRSLGLWLLVFSFTVPIFRSGQRTELTLFGWLVNHTIWGPPVEYIPSEQYQEELEEV